MSIHQNPEQMVTYAYAKRALDQTKEIFAELMKSIDAGPSFTETSQIIDKARQELKEISNNYYDSVHRDIAHNNQARAVASRLHQMQHPVDIFAKQLKEHAKQFEKHYPDLDSRKDFLTDRIMKTLGRQRDLLEKEVYNLSIARPANEKDIAERNNIRKNFTRFNERLQGQAIAYHGAPLYSTEGILKSGEISHGSDRLGYETNGYEAAGTISVTTPETAYVSIDYAEKDLVRELPYGTIFCFSLKPEEIDDAKRFVHDNVDLREPGRLIAIITTEESLQYLSDKYPEYRGYMKTEEEFEKDLSEKLGLVPKEYEEESHEFDEIIANFEKTDKYEITQEENRLIIEPKEEYEDYDWYMELSYDDGVIKGKIMSEGEEISDIETLKEEHDKIYRETCEILDIAEGKDVHTEQEYAYER